MPDRRRRRPLRGRDAELEAIGTCLATPSGSRSNVILIEGVTGSGKTRMLDEAAQIASRLGRPVGRAAGDRVDAPPALLPLLSAMADASMLKRRDCRERAPAALVTDAIAGLSATREPAPVLLLDDVHWADNETLVTLASLARAPSAGISYVLTRRAGTGGEALHRTWDALLREGAVRLQLGPLDEGAVDALVRDTHGDAVDRELRAALDAVHGRPSLVTAMLDDMGTFERTKLRMRAELETLPTPVRDAVVATATSREAATIAQIAALLSRAEGETRAAVGAARVAGQLEIDADGRVRCTSDLLRQAALADVAEAVIRARRREGAFRLASRGAPSREVGMLLVDSAERGDEQSASLLRTASRECADTHVADAARFAAAALELGRPGALPDVVLVSNTVELFVAAGQPERAHAVAVQALEQPLPEAAEATVRLALLRASDALAPEERLAIARAGTRLRRVSAEVREAFGAHVAFALLATGAAGTASAVLGAQRQRQGRASSPATDALHRRIDAELALRRGDLVLARQLARSAGGGEARRFAVQLEAAVGDVTAAISEAAQEAERARTPMERQAWEAVHTRALLAAGSSTGDETVRWTAPRTETELTRIAAELECAGAGLVLSAPGALPSLVRAALAVGHRPLATVFSEVAKSRSLAAGGHPLAAAVAAHACALLAGDPERLRVVADHLRGAQRELDLSAVLEDLAGLVSGKEATDALLEALDLASSAGAQDDVKRLTRRLRAAGVGRRRGHATAPTWGGLTASELEVVRLIAAGATKREAAEQLFLSRHTVSTHLRHAYVKLGIRSRVELARVVHANGP